MTTRYQDLTAIVAEHQKLAAENYDRVRSIAEHVRGGFCAYLASPDGDCVHLVPPYGPFEAKEHGDQAFSMPPQGFRPIAPIVFGLAVRVSDSGDWMRVALHCVKEGEQFTVHIADGKSHEFQMPLPIDSTVHGVFFDMLHEHLTSQFREQMDAYVEGEYGGNDIGFHMNSPPDGAPAQPVKAVGKPLTA